MDFPRRFDWSMLSWRPVRRPNGTLARPAYLRTSTHWDGHETASLSADCPDRRPRPRCRRLRRWRLDKRPVERRCESRERHDHEGAVQLPARRREAFVQGAEGILPE